MYKILYLNVFIFSCLIFKAQDTINYINGRSIAVKIIEVNPLEIKFKKFENPDGPLYSEDKSNIVFIKYSNGFIDVFPVKIKPAETLTNSPAIYNKINKFSHWYYFVDQNNSKISKSISFKNILSKAENLSKERNLMDLNLLVTKTRKNKKQQILFGIIGAPLIGVGLATSLLGYVSSVTSTQNNDVVFYEKAALVGLGIATVGLGFEITSLINRSLKQNRLEQTIKVYNDNL